MTPRPHEAEEAARLLGLDTRTLHSALRDYAVSCMNEAATQFRGYDEAYGSTIALARRYDRAATVCFEAWEQVEAAKAKAL